MSPTLFLADEEATLAFGRHIASVTGGRGLVTLQGDLGSGKTTLSRGLIRALGHTGAVKSPTFTLVEPYELANGQVLHYDLYRLNDPEELHFLGVRDFLDGDTLTLVEWPERGRHWLPAADLALQLQVSGNGRQASWQAHTPRGEAWSLALARLTQSF
jgi:tRNA threonylcarbamoyladenosine biosynthesis protein TsaE